MKNINRKDALSLLSKLDSDSLSSGEHQVLIDLKMLLLEHQDLEDACVADLNGYKAWTVWDGKQDVLDRMHVEFDGDITHLSDADLEKAADYITYLHKGRVAVQGAKDELLEEYGRLACTEADLAAVDASDLVRVRRGTFGCEGLVRNRAQFGRKYPKLLVEKITLEDMMLLIGKGETV